MKIRNLAVITGFLVLSFNSVRAQIITDTAKAMVPIAYISDSATFSVTYGWAHKVQKFNYQFLKDQNVPNNADSFTVKKQKVAVGPADYYVEAPHIKTHWQKVKMLIEFIYPQ